MTTTKITRKEVFITKGGVTFRCLRESDGIQRAEFLFAHNVEEIGVIHTNKWTKEVKVTSNWVTYRVEKSTPSVSKDKIFTRLRNELIDGYLAP